MELTKKAVETALRAISYAQPDVRETYKLQRMLDRAGQRALIRPRRRAVDMVVKCGDHPVSVRIFFPPEELPPRGVLLFFHGGGWVTGDIDTYDRVCAVTVQNTGCIVASVDYRLAPEHKFPCGLMDCYETARYLFWNSWDVLGVGPEEIVLMGDSAGGNLAAAVSLMARDRGEFTPKRQILFYPATHYDHGLGSPFPSVRENGTDFVLTAERVSEFTELYQREPEDLKNPYFSPLLAELSHQPETLVVTAELDPLRDEGEAYGEKLREAGNQVSIYRMMKALHGFLSLPAGSALVKRSYQMINAFLQGELPDKLEGVKNEIETEPALEPS